MTDLDVSVIVPARNEERCLADCLRTLVSQTGVEFEIIVVDDHSDDATRAIAESFGIRVLSAGALPRNWSGKCNAVCTGAGNAKGKWLLFTDADTRHQLNSISHGLREATEHNVALLSYSPKQEVHGLAERALMPLIFAELAAAYPPKEVSNPQSPLAAANGQYLLIRRDVYEKVGGHAAVATAILEDVELAKLVKRAGYQLRFRVSQEVSTRMYHGFAELWNGWTKNLALLFPHPRGLALRRMFEFAAIVAAAMFSIASLARGGRLASALAAIAAAEWLYRFLRRIRHAHFDWLSNTISFFGLPVFAVLLLNSYISHKRGSVRWKGRSYGTAQRDSTRQAELTAGRRLSNDAL